MNNRLYRDWMAIVRECFSTDTTENRGWGLAYRFESKRHKRVLSHEMRLKNLLAARMRWNGRPQFKNPKGSGDGRVSIHGQDDELWYELKSIYAPHFHGEKHPHNQDYERFLRLGHPCGALSDVERLRNLPAGGAAEKVFLLLMICWARDRPALRSYEQHREILANAFMQLARLGKPTDSFSVNSSRRGPHWSCVVRAWRL